MRRSFVASVITLSLLLGFLVGPAAAQAGVEVPVGGSVDVSNGTECPPNTTATIFLDVDGQEQLQLGSAISDEAGHLETSVQVPEDQPLGPASIIVNCGIENSVLVYNIELVEKSGFSMPGLLPILVGILAIGALAALFILRRSGNDEVDEQDHATDRSDAISETAAEDHADSEVSFDDVPMETALASSTYGDDSDSDVLSDIDSPAGIALGAPSDGDDPLADLVGGASAATAGAVGADAGDDEDDDGAEYWFWDVETSRGPARRLACLTDDSFHLDEIPLPAFPALLERITAEGPQTALSRGFLSVSLDSIQGVYRRGTEVKIAYAGPEGQQAKTIDLGTEVDGVVDLLSRRFVINTVPAPTN